MLRFQYSLCRIVYCCLPATRLKPGWMSVSIFALSNRVLLPRLCPNSNWTLAVFQYSLCRIVYCCQDPDVGLPFWRVGFNIRSVESCTAATKLAGIQDNATVFQYSLCRIVYCCPFTHVKSHSIYLVSIFALSNRVLLPWKIGLFSCTRRCFNIRSVESCTAAYRLHRKHQGLC